MDFNENSIIFLADGYKYTHHRQYPPNTTYVQSYFESRGYDTRYGVDFTSTCFFGLQAMLMQYFVGQVVTKADIDAADYYCAKYFGDPTIFNRKGWEYILAKHNGRLPLRIKAVEEGSVVPLKNALIVVESTDPECFWLTSFVETLLSQIWYPITVATLSREMKRMILGYLEMTGTPDEIDYKLVDFGFRGVSSVETAKIGGLSHLVNFKAGDTFPANLYGHKYYDIECPSSSIPASEHSTITSWGKENELEAFSNMLEEFPAGLVACVSDSYDIYSACKNLWGDKLKNIVLSRNGVLIIRPDGGNAVDEVPTILGILDTAFGSELNAKGYNVLNPHVRVLQGDSIYYGSANAIYNRMAWKRFSADNLSLGSGGGLLQKLNRDTLKCAYKTCEVTANGVDRAVFKSPVNEPFKRSKSGSLKLIMSPTGQFQTVNTTQSGEDLMSVVYEDGRMVKTTTFDKIRRLAAIRPEEIIKPSCVV